MKNKGISPVLSTIIMLAIIIAMTSGVYQLIIKIFPPQKEDWQCIEWKNETIIIKTKGQAVNICGEVKIYGCAGCPRDMCEVGDIIEFKKCTKEGLDCRVEPYATCLEKFCKPFNEVHINDDCSDLCTEEVWKNSEIICEQTRNAI